MTTEEEFEHTQNRNRFRGVFTLFFSKKKIIFNFFTNNNAIKPYSSAIRSSTQGKNASVIKRIEQELKFQKEKHQSMLTGYDEYFEILADNKKVHKLRQENLSLRNELKRLNDLINQLVEFHRGSLQRRGKFIRSFRSDIDIKELQNAEKQLENSQREFQLLSERFDKFSNPQYMVELKERILGYDERIKKMGRNKKKLEVSQLHREKAIHQVIEGGEPELLQEINDYKIDTAVTTKKITEFDEKLERNATLIKEQHNKVTEVSSKLREVEKEASGLGLDSLPQPVSLTARNNEYSQLKGKKNQLINEISLIKGRHNVNLGDYTHHKVMLQKTITDSAKAVQKKNDLWISNIQEITDIVEKIRGSYKEIVEPIIQRWKEIQINIDLAKSRNREPSQKSIYKKSQDTIEETIKEEIGKEETEKGEIIKEEIGKEETVKKDKIIKGKIGKEETVKKDKVIKGEIGKEETAKKDNIIKEEIGKKETVKQDNIMKGETVKIVKKETVKKEIDKDLAISSASNHTPPANTINHEEKKMKKIPPELISKESSVQQKEKTSSKPSPAPESLPYAPAFNIKKAGKGKKKFDFPTLPQKEESEKKSPVLSPTPPEDIPEISTESQPPKKTFNFHAQQEKKPTETSSPKPEEKKKIEPSDASDPFGFMDNYDPLAKYTNPNPPEKPVPTLIKKEEGPLDFLVPANDSPKIEDDFMNLIMSEPKAVSNPKKVENKTAFDDLEEFDFNQNNSCIFTLQYPQFQQQIQQ